MRHIKLGRLIAAAFALFLNASPALAAFALTNVTRVLSATTNTTLATGNETIASGTLVIVDGGMRTVVSGLTDTAKVIDAAGNAYNTVTCATTIGSQVVDTFVGYSILATGLSAQKITLETTSGSGWTTSAFLSVEKVTGGAASSPEDIAARACQLAGTTATTTPTVTSGIPTTSNEFLFGVYINPGATTSFTWTEDTADGWSNITSGGGGTTIVYSAADQTNAGSGATPWSPTTASRTYVMQIMGLCPSGGCATAAKHSLLFSPVP